MSFHLVDQPKIGPQFAKPRFSQLHVKAAYFLFAVIVIRY